VRTRLFLRQSLSSPTRHPAPLDPIRPSSSHPKPAPIPPKPTSFRNRHPQTELRFVNLQEAAPRATNRPLRAAAARTPPATTRQPSRARQHAVARPTTPHSNPRTPFLIVGPRRPYLRRSKLLRKTAPQTIHRSNHRQTHPPPNPTPHVTQPTNPKSSILLRTQCAKSQPSP
jgi:hypothetical protein